MNRGTGAGGARTNKNGLSYEVKIKEDLKTLYTKEDNHIIFNDDDDKLKYKVINKGKFDKKYLKKREKKGGHGCKRPDICFLRDNILFIIEVKNQNCSGSVCEKIQTGPYKVRFYKKYLKENYKSVYIYVLSEWFRDNCADEIEYLKEANIPVFIADSPEYKKQLCDYIINYSF